VLDVTVATATMVITPADDPYRVLVGYSAKHKALVLPGGKLKPGAAPLDGARRETLEEAGGDLVGAVEIGVATDHRLFAHGS
jgi:8-oxo-dGTP pyrophosphatase MutT (NUDIX family)